MQFSLPQVKWSKATQLTSALNITVASFSLLPQTVVDAYWKRLEDVKLGGPTYLAPVIQQIAAYAEREVSQCSQHYTIGLVIVDGIINDLESLTNTLIEVGNLALSIVVVGVGPADFRLMVKNVKVMRMPAQ